MRERAVNLRDWEVSAALAGRLTMLVRPMVARDHGDPTEWAEEGGVWHPLADQIGRGLESTGPGVRCRFGQPGDRLWGREAWMLARASRDCEGIVDDEIAWRGRAPKTDPRGKRLIDDWCLGYAADGGEGPWRSSTQMPRWAARVVLVVEAVRVVQAQQGLTEAEAEATGIERVEIRHVDGGEVAGSLSYHHSLMRALRGSRSPSWRHHPWVWAAKVRWVEAAEKRGAA